MTTPPDAEADRELLSLAAPRIGDAVIADPVYVDGDADLVAVCRELAAQGQTQALVRDGGRIGIFTTTDLRDALLRADAPATLAVRDFAAFDLVTVPADAELYDALWRMVGRQVHRVVVVDGDRIVGVLGPHELLAMVAGQAQLIAAQIDDAPDVAALTAAALRIDEMVRSMHGNGIAIDRIARRVSDLNARLIARTWRLVARPDVVAHSCLLVMGSEGRGEQIVRTDQDNALLLRDGWPADGVERVAADFGDALADIGYPPCPGGVMIRNPQWRQPLSRFKQTIGRWTDGDASADGPMHLAIFMDAVAVAGDASLLAEARGHLLRHVGGSDAFLARFAAAADRFNEPLHWFNWLTSRRDELPLDIKKLGVFPIVHGARALALQYRIAERGTAARLRRLAADARIDAALARDCVDALHLMMSIRLTHQLRQIDAGEAAGNSVRPSALSTLEREPLRDALAIVKRFRGFLRQHFQLDVL